MMPLETCREWLDAKLDYCHAPADLIFWGKLYPRETLGPRCMRHATQHLQFGDEQEIRESAIFDLRPLRKEAECST